MRYEWQFHSLYKVSDCRLYLYSRMTTETESANANLLRGFDECALELVVAQRHVQRLVDLVVHVCLPIHDTQVADKVAASANCRLPAADPDVLLAGRRRRSRGRLRRLILVARVRHFGLLAGWLAARGLCALRRLLSGPRLLRLLLCCSLFSWSRMDISGSTVLTV